MVKIINYEVDAIQVKFTNTKVDKANLLLLTIIIYIDIVLKYDVV